MLYLSNFEKIKKKTLQLFRSQHFASFDTNTSPVAQKLWELGSLEVVKLEKFQESNFSADIVLNFYWW